MKSLLASAGVVLTVLSFAAYQHVNILSPGCNIKANIGENGRIYHVSGQRYYGATKINPLIGDRWFCSEAKAQAAGWRGHEFRLTLLA